MEGRRGKLIAVARKLSEPEPGDIPLPCDTCRALGQQKYGRPVCRRTGGECLREAAARARGALLGTLSLPAAQAFAIFNDSLTQISSDFGVVLGLRYSDVESACRAHRAEWPDVFPYIRVLEREFVKAQTPKKKGSASGRRQSRSGTPADRSG